ELFFPLARDAAEWRGKARERGRQVLELRRRKEKEKQEEEARSGEAGDRAVRDAADAIRDDAGEAPATASPARTVPAGRLLRTYDATEDAPAAVSTAASPDELTSIIVLTRNGVEDTRLCLDSIATHTYAPHEVIVVDNGSTDGTLDHLRWRLARTGNLRVVRNAANRGFAAGINLGLAIAHGARIVLLNNDTVVTPGWLGGLAAVLDENDDCGVVGPMTNHASGPQVVANVPYRTLAGMQEFALDWTCRHSGSEVARRLVGFCWMMRREVVDEIGGLDERFGTGNCEDDDYCLRVHQAGWKTRIARGVFVHHTGSRTFRSENIDYDAQLRKNFEVFRSKWRLGPEASVEKPYPFLEIVKGPAQPRVRLPEIAGTHQLCERGRWHRDRHPGANAAVAADETTGEMVDRTFRLAVGVLPGGQLTRETRALFERYGFREEPPAWETTAHIAAQLRDKPLVLMLGPDVVVPDDALQEMLEVLREHDDVAGVGPVSNAAPPGQRDRPGYGDVGRELRRFATRRRRQRRGQVKSVTHLGGFCLLLRGAAIREVGGLDESLPIEDALLDLFERLRGAGRRVVVASGAWVHQARPTPVEGAAYGTRETHKSGVDG
ncbi:MAG TPA: glycosyltransferase, partial [bacterium]|nr:glycosyltransferase [bacterium]